MEFCKEIKMENRVNLMKSNRTENINLIMILSNKFIQLKRLKRNIGCELRLVKLKIKCFVL